MPRGYPSKLKSGSYNSPLYKKWAGMKRRCYNPNEAIYKHYGGRGITVCDEWLNNPQAFIDWAERNGYQPGLTIERENNDLGYSPSNCIWVTMAEQNHNTRQTKLDVDKVKFIRKALKDGTHTGVELAALFDVSTTLISNVKKELNWSTE